jgi:hypothetical protein
MERLFQAAISKRLEREMALKARVCEVSSTAVNSLTANPTTETINRTQKTLLDHSETNCAVCMEKAIPLGVLTC